MELTSPTKGCLCGILAFLAHIHVWWTELCASFLKHSSNINLLITNCAHKLPKFRKSLLDHLMGQWRIDLHKFLKRMGLWKKRRDMDTYEHFKKQKKLMKFLSIGFQSNGSQKGCPWEIKNSTTNAVLSLNKQCIPRNWINISQKYYFATGVDITSEIISLANTFSRSSTSHHISWVVIRVTVILALKKACKWLLVSLGNLYNHLPVKKSFLHTEWSLPSTPNDHSPQFLIHNKWDPLALYQWYLLKFSKWTRHIHH